VRCHPPAAIFVVPFAIVAAALPAQHQQAPLVGTVLDPDGKPLAGVAVRVLHNDARLFSCLDLVYANEWREVAAMRTDKAGRFGVQLPLGLALRVDVDVPPHARWSREPVIPGEPLDVKLEAPCSIAGRVVDEKGKAVAARLRLTRGYPRATLGEGGTDAEGSFRFERLSSGKFSLWTEPTHAMAPMWIDGELAAGEQRVVELTAPAGQTLTGRVTDAATGEAIAGATIGEGWTLHKAVTTDASGAYTMRGYGSPGYGFEVQCKAPGFAGVAFRDVAREADPVHLDIALHRGARVVGRILDPQDQPVVDAYIAAVGTDGIPIAWHAARTGADGTFACEGFPRGLDGALLVRARGFASLTFFLPRPAADGQVDFGTVRMRAAMLLRGVVNDDDHTPIAGATVELVGTNGDVAWLATAPAAWGRLERYCGRRAAVTDTRGEFAFGDLPPGDYTASWTARGAANNPPVTLTIQAGQEPTVLQLKR
jgi:protocatechuate 3,4-dioxygenase beta subunit